MPEELEQELRAAKHFAESIVETIHEPLLVLTPDLRVVSANRAFYEHFQVRPEETRGALVYRLGNGQFDTPALRHLLEEVLPDDEVFEDFLVERELERIGFRSMLLNGRRLDHLQRILLGIRDVTEEKRIGDALRELNETLEAKAEARAHELAEREERYRKLVEASGIAVWTADADGRVREGSGSWRRYTGQSHEEWEWKGAGWADAVHPDERAKALEAWRASVAAERPVDTEVRLFHAASGTYRWTNVRALPLREARGAVRGWIGLHIDIHERKRAEEALRRMATRLTMAEQQERRRLAHVLHDDLQQVLYGIEMKLSLIQKDLGEAAAGDAIGQVRDWVGRAVRTTRRLTVELSPPILEQEGLGDALEWLRRQMAELHGLEVTLERDADAPIPDEDRRLLLFQIVRELLFNVRKHAGTRRATVWLGAADGAVTIDVRDAGRGFDPRTLDRTDATGLGLVSIRERLRQIGGTLDVRSAPGEGARIVVSAPRVHEG